MPVAAIPPTTFTVPVILDVESVLAFAVIVFAADMLLPLMLPVTSSVPVMLAPVPVTVITRVPPLVTVISPSTPGILTSLVPLAILDVPTEVQVKLPVPSVVNAYPAVPPVIFTLPTGPKLDTPPTVKLANVPTLVILG